MADQRIVTEIIVDARQAEAGMAAVAAASRAAQREFDKSIAKSLENAAALKRVGEAGKDTADVLTLSSAGLNKAAAAADAYRGRLDPLVFAQNALGKELRSVEQAIFAVDTMNQKGRRTDEEAIKQVAELTVRKKELVGVLAQVKGNTILAADAMTYLKTESERNAAAVKVVVVAMADYVARAEDVVTANKKMIASQQAFNARAGFGGNPLYGAAKDARESDLASAFVGEYNKTRAALVPLEAETQKYAARLAAVADAQNKWIITSTEANAAIELIRAGTSDAVKSMRDFEAAIIDAAAANEKMATSQAAFNAKTGVGGNPLYGSERAKREAELTAAFVDEYRQAREAIIPLEAEQRKLKESQDAITNALNRGIIESHEATAAMKALQIAIHGVVETMSDYQARAADVVAANQKMANSQRAFNARAGVGGDPLFGAARDERQAGLESTFSQFDKLRASIDPLFAAFQKYEAELERIAAVESKVAGMTTVATAARDRAKDSYQKEVEGIIGLGKAQEKTGASAGQMKFANQQLTVQMSQFFSGIATGQPIMMTFIQQGHQVLDVMWASGITMKEMAGGALKIFNSAFAAILTPVGLAITAFAAVAGAITAVAVAAERANIRMGTLLQQGSAVRDNFGQMALEADKAAKNIARTTSISTTDARGITSALNKDINFTGTHKDMQVFAEDIEKLSILMGEDIPAATKRFTDSLALPSSGAEALIGKLKSFDAAFVDSLKGMEARGKYVEAFNLLMERQRKALEDVHKPVTDLDKAHERLAKAFTSSSQEGRSFMERLGQPFVTMLTWIENKIAAVVEKLTELGDKFPSVTKTIGMAVGQLPGFGMTGAVITAMGTGGGAATPGAAEGSVTLTTRSGVKYTVRKDLAPQFQGFINDLEATGYNIYEMSSSRPGATVKGTGAPSRHGSDSAVDINPRDNAVGTEGNIGRALALGLAKKWGLTSGYLFKDTDPMHIGTDMLSPDQIADNQRRVLNAGQIQYQTGGTITRRLEENTREQAKAQAALNIELERYNKAQGEDNKEAMDLATTAGAKNLEVLQKLRGERVLILSTQDAETRSRENANKALVGEVGAERDIAAARERYRVLGEEAGTGVDRAALFRAETAQLAALTIQFNDSVTAIDLQTQALSRQTPALELGGQAAEFAANHEKALEDARRTSLPNTEERIRQVRVETEALNAQTMAKRENQAATSVAKSNEQLEMLRLEISLVTASTEERTREIAVLQKRQELGLKIADQATPMQQKALDGARAVADMNTQFQISTQAVQEIGNLATQAFDQVGTAITNAFVGGQGAAVNFGNVAKAVMTSVLQEVIKLSILNPILNAVIGGPNRTTLLQVFDAYGLSGGSVTGAQAAASGGGSGGGLGGLGGLGSVASGASSLYKAGSGLLGAFQPGGIFTSTGMFGYAGSTANFLATPIFGSVSGSATNAALAGMGSQFGPATAGAYTAAGGAVPSTIGAFALPAAGFAAGFGLGSVGGGYLQSSLGKTGPGPMIGAGTGALAGTAIGMLGGPVGALIGGIIGGILGGGAGGFIGPKAPSVWSSTRIGLDETGHAIVGASLGQGVNNAAEAKQAMDDVMTLNSFLDSTSTKLTSLGDIAQLGKGSGADKAASVAAAFSQFRFGPSGSDPTLSKYLTDRSFADIDQFQAAIREYRALVDTTIPALLKVGQTTGTLADQFKELNAQFEPAVGAANKYGVSITDIMAVHAEQEKKLRDAANKTISDADVALRLRKRVAEGGDAQSIELESFDVGAAEQREAFKQQMIGIFGDAITQTEWFAPQMALLEETLGAERLAIVKKYADQITQQERAIGQIHENFAIRLMNARGTGTPESRELFAFDINAARERISFGEQLTGIFGLAYKNTADYGQEMARLEEVLGAERLAVIKKYADALAQADRTLFRANEDLNTRILNARPGEAMAKELQVFDINARRETEDFTRTLLDTYGEAFATSKRYADSISLMEEAHGAERAAIVEKYFNDARQKAASAVASLASYASGLSLSQASPLSQQDQLTLARNRFNAVAGAAGAGDYNSIQQLQGYADSFLAASRVVYGSGEAYATDFQRVLEALGQVANVAPDTLTASVMQTETRTQTSELVASLAELKAAVDTVTTQLRQNATAPARIAA